jgi:hypothetical protein
MKKKYMMNPDGTSKSAADADDSSDSDDSDAWYAFYYIKSIWLKKFINY